MLAASMLCGCAKIVHYLAAESALQGSDRDTALVSRTFVVTLHARAKSLHIGTPDCAVDAATRVYYRVCYVPIDGRLAPVGLRYDDGVERIIPHLLWALVSAKTEERSIAAIARYDYGSAATVTCPGPQWRVLPPGDRFACSVKTGNGIQHRVDVVVRNGTFGPYPAIGAIPGVRLTPQSAQLEANVASQLRSKRSIPGPLIVQSYDLTTLPFFNAAAPEMHAGKMLCPRAVAPGDLNGFCSIETSFGYLRLGVEVDAGDRIHFHLLSLPTNMRIAERTGAKLIEAAYRRTGIAVVARVDCGPAKWVTLSLPSVYYCTVALSNGHRSRMGVEYYDEIERIHLSFESMPSPIYKV